MRKIVRLVVSLCLLWSVSAAMPASALVYSSCSGTFTSAPAVCVFTPVGPELYVSGHNSVLTGAGVRVRITDPTRSVTILECSGFYDCIAHLGSSTPTDSVGPPAGIGPLVCQVLVGSSGSFGCSSRS